MSAIPAGDSREQLPEGRGITKKGQPTCLPRITHFGFPRQTRPWGSCALPGRCTSRLARTVLLQAREPRRGPQKHALQPPPPPFDAGQHPLQPAGPEEGPGRASRRCSPCSWGALAELNEPCVFNSSTHFLLGICPPGPPHLLVLCPTAPGPLAWALLGYHPPALLPRGGSGPSCSPAPPSTIPLCWGTRGYSPRYVECAQLLLGQSSSSSAFQNTLKQTIYLLRADRLLSSCSCPAGHRF